MFKGNHRVVLIGIPVSAKEDTRQSVFNKYLLTPLAILTMAFFLTFCSSGGDDPAGLPLIVLPTLPTQLSGTLGAAGGTLTSSNGKLSLMVPPGALAADTEITITEMAEDEVPSVFDGFVVEKAFRVEPIGLDFAGDVEITLTLGLEPPSVRSGRNRDLQVDLEVRFIAMSDDAFEELGFPDTELEIGNNRVFHASTSELNDFAVTAVPDILLWIDGQVLISEDVIENQPFETSMTMVVSDLLDWDAETHLLAYSAESFILDLEHGDIITPDSETLEPDGSTMRTFVMPTTPTEAGTQSLELGLLLRVTPSLIPDPPTIDIEYKFPPRSVEVAEESPSAGSIALGTYNVSLPGAESIFPIRGTPDWQLNDTAIVAYNNGAQFLGLSPALPFSQINTDFASFGRIYGLLVVVKPSLERAASGYQAILFGPNGGAVSNWVPANNGFGMMQLFAFNHNLTDALPYDNDPASAGYCYVDNTVGIVYLTEFDIDTGFFQSAGYVSGFPEATGLAVSAFVREEGSLLTAVDGTPGRLYLHDLVSFISPATYIADLGNSPRRIRSLGDVAVVSNYASGTLTIVSWSQADEVAISGTVTVGDGPVGIDLLGLAGGAIAIVSTGFNDNTYWVTVVSSTGTVVSNTGYSLPAGITGPGHAVWLHDENKQILVSGNTTGNLAVVASGL